MIGSEFCTSIEHSELGTVKIHVVAGSEDIDGTVLVGERKEGLGFHHVMPWAPSDVTMRATPPVVAQRCGGAPGPSIECNGVAISLDGKTYTLPEVTLVQCPPASTETAAKQEPPAVGKAFDHLRTVSRPQLRGFNTGRRRHLDSCRV